MKKSKTSASNHEILSEPYNLYLVEFSLASRSCFLDLHINRKNCWSVHVTVSVHQYFWDVLIKPSRERKSLLDSWIWLKTGLFWLDHFNARFKKFCYSVVDLLVCFRSLSCCITNTTNSPKFQVTKALKSTWGTP